MAQVGIVMGSDSDMPVMAKAADILEELGISYEMTIISAHREPDVFFEYAKGAEEKGFKVIIAGAGMAAHLPGMCAAIFPMPIPSTMGKQVLDLCKHHKIPVLTATESHPVLSSEEIRAFLSENGIHLYTEEDAVVYVGNGYIAYHSVTGGIKALRLPKPLHLSPVFGANITAVSECEIFFTMSENGSALFTVS